MRIREPMRASRESNLTTGLPGSETRAAGIWSLTASGAIINEPDGPATLLVPTEQVLLLTVDLPLKSHARRIAALPFAIEDRIADPVESVHIALGAVQADGRYLIGVVRHEVMERWVATAEAEGLGRATMLPDALMVMAQAGDKWAVDLEQGRALVRTPDGAGFACPQSLLRPAWEAAGRPPVHAYGEALDPDMQVSASRIEHANLIAGYDLDLRQGRYARRAAPLNNVWRRLGWVALIGAAAHMLIATADTVMLRVIADRRAAETQALVASMGGAPGGNIADMLPQTGGAPQIFLPLLSRISAALTPMAASFTVRAIEYQANVLTMDLDTADPGLADRLRAALASARVKATVSQSATGGLRVTASPT
jgi:general secretion pathway protein L